MITQGTAHARRTWLLVLLTAFAMLAAGCDGDNGGGSDSASADADVSEQVKESAEGVDEDFAALVEAYENATYSVTYGFEGSGMGGDTAGMDEITFSSDGERTAYSFGETMSMHETADGKSVVCSGLEGGQPSCIESPMDEAGSQLGMAAGLFSITAGLNEEVGDVDRTDDQEIAGRTGQCWTFEWDWLGASADAITCLDSETGVPLLVEWGGESTEGDSGSFKMEATEFSDSPTDEQLDPPADAQSMDQMMEDAGVSAEQLQEMQEQMEGMNP